MPIQIDRVRISGFRGISNIEIVLPRVAVLIGANNSGKTSVIKALQLALGDYSRHLTDEDFYIDKNENPQGKIYVDTRFIAVTDKFERKMTFSEKWAAELGDGQIQAEADGSQYVGIRTIARHDSTRGYVTERYSLSYWPNFDKWSDAPTAAPLRKGRYESIPFISIDAQRDIHAELKEKSSFVGRVLSSVEYDDADIKSIEEMVAVVNKEAIDKSESLRNLKKHLDNLNRSFDG